EVMGLQRCAAGLTLVLSGDAKSGAYDHAVVAVPAEQAVRLLSPIAPSMAMEAQAAHTSPCWAVMVAFSSAIEVGFEAARVLGSSPLAWIAQMKGDGSDHSCWVLHATSAWSMENIEQRAEVVAADLARAFASLAGISVEPSQLSAHRWRYAQVQTSAGTPFAWNPDLDIGVCGDWRLGPRIECAWKSGDALGSEISQMMA
ncbi:MAG: NAD/FAD-dependent oxidoreductase, partial [Alphaproteobacteria bacterium]